MKNLLQYRLKELREAAKLTQKELGQKLGGLSDSTVNNYESGKRHPGYETLVKLADIFGVTTDYLVGKDNTWKYDLSEELREFVLNEENEVYLVLAEEIKRAGVLPDAVKAFIEGLLVQSRQKQS